MWGDALYCSAAAWVNSTSTLGFEVSSLALLLELTMGSVSSCQALLGPISRLGHWK